jgi:hypothetical protein
LNTGASETPAAAVPVVSGEFQADSEMMASDGQNQTLAKAPDTEKEIQVEKGKKNQSENQENPEKSTAPNKKISDSETATLLNLGKEKTKKNPIAPNILEENPIAPNIQKATEKNTDTEANPIALNAEKADSETSLSADNLSDEGTESSKKRKASGSLDKKGSKRMMLSVEESVENVVDALVADKVVAEKCTDISDYVKAVCSLFRATPSNQARHLLPALVSTVRSFDAVAPEFKVLRIEKQEGDTSEIPDLSVVNIPEIVDLSTESDAYRRLVLLFSQCKKDNLLQSVSDLETTTESESILDFLLKVEKASDKFQLASEYIAKSNKRSKMYAIMAVFSSMVFASEVICTIIRKETVDGESRAGMRIPIDLLMQLIVLQEPVPADLFGLSSYTSYWRWAFPRGLGEPQMAVLKTGISALMMCCRLGIAALFFPKDVYLMSILNKIKYVDLKRCLKYESSTDNVRHCVDSAVLHLERLGILESVVDILPCLENKLDVLEFMKYCL